MYERAIVVDDFYGDALALRREFDRKLGETLLSDPPSTDRFIWDYWHVPNQFSYTRASSQTFFGEELMNGFRARLRDWIDRNLGLSGIVGSPWLSYYVDGGEQRTHADGRNGGWAYVYSLTNWGVRDFTGGDTCLLRSDVAAAGECPDSWARAPQSFETIEPHFNRLIVFNSQIPHGVTPVVGTRDPLRGRVVIHGWLTSGLFTVAGALARSSTIPVLQEAFGKMEDLLGDLDASGVVAARVEVRMDGSVSRVQLLSNTIAFTGGGAVAALLTEMKAVLHALRFPPSAGTSILTIPLDISS
jgi:hypothetical protein